MVVRYGNKTDKLYHKIVKLYHDQVLKAASAKTTAIYSYHDSLYEIANGLEYLHNDPVLLKVYGKYCLEIDRESAMSYFEKTLQIIADDPEALYFKALSYSGELQYPSAISCLERSLAKQQKPMTLFTYSFCLIATQQTKKAQKLLMTLKASDHPFAQHLQKILLLTAQKKNSMAHSYIQKITPYLAWRAAFDVKWLVQQITKHIGDRK